MDKAPTVGHSICLAATALFDSLVCVFTNHPSGWRLLVFDSQCRYFCLPLERQIEAMESDNLIGAVVTELPCCYCEQSGRQDGSLSSKGNKLTDSSSIACLQHHFNPNVVPRGSSSGSSSVSSSLRVSPFLLAAAVSSAASRRIPGGTDYLHASC